MRVKSIEVHLVRLLQVPLWSLTPDLHGKTMEGGHLCMGVELQFVKLVKGVLDQRQKDEVDHGGTIDLDLRWAFDETGKGHRQLLDKNHKGVQSHTRAIADMIHFKQTKWNSLTFQWISRELHNVLSPCPIKLCCHIIVILAIDPSQNSMLWL